MNSETSNQTMSHSFLDFGRSLIVDASGWGEENTGLKVFCECVLAKFLRNPPKKYAELIVLIRAGADFQRLKKECPENVTFETVSFKPIGLEKELWFLRNVRRVARCDFLSLSSYLPIFLFSRTKACIVHDLKYVEIPSFLGSKLKQGVLRIIMRWSIHHADRVFAVSEYTKSRIKKIYGRYDVVVTHEGMPSKFNAVEKNYQLPEKKYFLCVSEYRPHKNLHRTVEAFIDANRDNSFALIIVGRDVTKLEEKFRSYVENGTLILKVNIDDKQLGALYQKAHAFLYMSLYEGFGLPILEAQKFGVPVLTANSTSTQEVAGSSCLLADPESTLEISRAIFELMKPGELCGDLAERGYQNIERFSWDKASSILAEEMNKVDNRI